MTAGLLLAGFAGAALAGEYARGPVPRGGRIFYASFDHGPRVDEGVGFPEMHYAGRFWGRKGWEFAYVPGRVGKAVDLRMESLSEEGKSRVLRPKGFQGYLSAAFKAHGFVCLPQGSLSFWLLRGREPAVVTVDIQDNDRWACDPILEFRADAKSSRLLVSRRDYARRSYAIPGPPLSLTQWAHVALAWDEARGVRVYVDGELRLSSWGKATGPAGYLSTGVLSLSGGVFDEVQVSDRVLTERQVQALAAGETTDAAGPAVAIPREHVLKRLGWDGPDVALTPADGATQVRKADLADARALRMAGWRGVDGRHDSVWPLHYHGYEYLNGGGLHLTLAPGQCYNAIRVVGAIDHAVVCPGAALRQPADAPVLAKLEGRRFVTTYLLPEARSSSAVSVYPDPDRDRSVYRKSCRQLHDLALLHITAGAPAWTGHTERYRVTGQAPKTVCGANRVRLIQWYRPSERRVLLVSQQHDTEADALAFEPLRFLHVMLPPFTVARPLSAVDLDLRVRGWRAGNRVNVRVHDPLNLWRELIDVDLVLKQPERLRLTLEFPATVLPKGHELWLSLVAEQGGRLMPDSTVAVHGPDLAEALETYRRWQLRLLNDTYAVMSEPRPWGATGFDDTWLRVAMPVYDCIARMVWDLYRRFPEDHVVQSYMYHTHPQESAYWRSLPTTYPKAPDVPEWAVLQKELLGIRLDFVNWWIDRRQAPNGELGNFYGDDTDLVGDWVSLHMLHDPGGKIKRSQRMIADYVWEHKMRNGLNIRCRDALHAYEEGLNVQPFAALLDYGNPVLWERLLATARRYDGHLMTHAKDGKREFRGTHFSDEKVITGRHPQSVMFLSLHAGLTLMWYNGHPGLKQMMVELFEGEDDKPKDRALGFAQALVDQTSDMRYIIRPNLKYGTTSWVRLLSLRDCPSSQLQGMIDYEYGTGVEGIRTLIKYRAWHYTRDKSHLAPALRYVWKKEHYSSYLNTTTEQSGDRIRQHKWLSDFMYLGGEPGSRGRTYPLFCVSYEGFSRQIAGLVIDGERDLLRWVGYNFEPEPQRGKLRVWRLDPGIYRVRMGLDTNDDDRIDLLHEETQMALKRYETIPVELPSRKCYLVEAKLVSRDVPLYDRCDLAVTHEDASRQGRTLTVVAHNLGSKPTGPFTVSVADATGRKLAEQRHAGLDGVLDLQAKRAQFTFGDMQARGALRVTLTGPGKEITDANNVTEIP